MNRPNRGSLLAARLKDRIKPAAPAEEDFWDDICRRMREGHVIPILGNAVRNELIFGSEDGGQAPSTGQSAPTGQSATGQTPPPGAGTPTGAPPAAVAVSGNGDGGGQAGEAPKSVDEQLAEIWADLIGYPLGDRYELARVAQFNRVRSADTEQAKSKYLDFLKDALLQWAEGDPAAAEVVAELRGQTHEMSFADIAQDLGLPHFSDPAQDPLRVLARLPLPIYVTTSYYDFMERALQAEGRNPRTQVCFWAGDEPIALPEHRTDPNFAPTPEVPLVYHLHGLERYPRTLVLSEDDYLDFLVQVSQDTDSRSPVIPLYLRQALAESSLILLGYRLQDWDFRTVFRGIVNPKSAGLRLFSLIIQLNPDEQAGIIDQKEARSYLEAYFEPSKFKVEWGNAQEFIQRLWQEWNEWRQGQA